ncbi:MAG: UvrD-helicase domain-containing protein [Firmicutes bacterium]|nr:UvrD-helicase domain-containing protein [Bacillota bacterium]
MKTTYYKRPAILTKPELSHGHAVIEASAGTGKTFTLEHLVIELLINTKSGSEIKIEEILVVTFTEAATRELRERVRSLIRKVCDESSPLPQGADPADYWEINDTVRNRLREALFRFDGAAISTIHGFCQRVLSEQAFLGGRLFEQEHTDGAEMFGMAFREEVRSALAEDNPQGEMLRLWIEQNRSLEELQNFLYACHREGSPDRCPVTPVWDPDGLKKAITKLPSAEALKAAGGTIFSGVAKKSYDSIIEALFNILDQIISAGASAETISAYSDWTRKERSLNKVKDCQIGHITRASEADNAPGVLSELRAGLTDIEDKLAGIESFFVHHFLKRVQKKLSARKVALGLIDYDDMLLGVLDALTGSGADLLLQSLRRRWKYALVDEFQDTDPVQWEIFRRIFVDGNGNQRLFVIGDPKQAIYGFRGADVHTYDQAKKYLINMPGSVRLPLTKNFRSTASMIEAINEILTVKDEKGHSFFSGLNRYDDLVVCGDPSRIACEHKNETTAPVHLVNLFGGRERLNSKSVARGTGCFIAEEIQRLVDPKEGLLTGDRENQPKPLKLSDIYILTRSGNEGRQIGEVLRTYGIPHAFYKQEGLFQTDEAYNLFKLLCAVNNPEDPGLRMSAWLTPFFNLPLEELKSWREAGENHPLAALLFKWRQLADSQAWSELFDTILTESGLIRRLVFTGSERALTNYLHLFELLLADAHTRPITLADLNRGLKARIDGRKLPEGRDGDIQRLETDREAVQILTMHKAKGLEAEVIFIGGGFGRFSGGRGIKTSIYHRNNLRHLHIGKATGEIAAAIELENREEDQRLFYVALTRAKSRLYLPYFGKGSGAGGEERSYGYCNLGPFYQAIQKQLDLLSEKGNLENRNKYMLREASCFKEPSCNRAFTTVVENWPEKGLIEMPASSAEEALEIRPGSQGVILTSYTRIKQGDRWKHLPADEEDRDEMRRDEAGAELQTVMPDTALAEESAAAEVPLQDELPGGREMGIFLHALLEETPAREVMSNSFDEWAALDIVQKRTAAAARSHGFGSENLKPALSLIYKALRTPLNISSIENSFNLRMPEGIASGLHQCREMSFTYPIPERYHKLLGNHRTENIEEFPYSYRVLRGYLQGLIDLVFEYNGIIYLLDWKSDRLPLYDRDSLARHVEINYDLQAKVYTLAVTRLLEINDHTDYNNRFGGVLYLFLRGLEAPDPADQCRQENKGIWYSRPSYDQIVVTEEEFLDREDWGGDVIVQKSKSRR